MDTEITFNTGHTLQFRPVSRQKVAKINLAVFKEFQDRDEALEPPTYYTIEPNEKDPAGVKEPHNETTLETDEDKLAWAKHQDALNRLSAEQSVRAYKHVLTKGIITDLTPSGEWIEENNRLGIELPEDEEELRLTYLYEEVLVSEKNISQAIAKILALGMEGIVPDSEVSAFEDTFRDTVEQGQEPDSLEAATGDIEPGTEE